MTPPTPPTPPTPEWIIEERIEREKARKQEENRKNLFINLINLCLDKFPTEEPLIACFSHLINSDMDLEKRYGIAKVINKIIEGSDLDNKEIQSQLIRQFKADIFDSKSILYGTLNYQRNIFPVTFFGKMHLISWNYAKSLQLAQSIVLREQNFIPKSFGLS